MDLGNFGVQTTLRSPTAIKPGTLSSELQEAKKAEEIRPLKASMFLAQKYPSRCSADDSEAWRGGSSKEPGEEIFIHQLCLRSCKLFKQISIFQ